MSRNDFIEQKEGLSNQERQDWLAFVESFVRAYKSGLKLASRQPVTEQGGAEGGTGDRPLVLICAPHPDDEVLTGSLALRLRRMGAPVLALALTLGSDPDRRAVRRDEMAAACREAGFSWRPVVEPLAFPLLHPGQELEPVEWGRMVAELEHQLARDEIALVLAPHGEDGHPSHRAAHRLVVQALINQGRSRGRRVLLAETEYWQPMKDANLLLGVAPEELAILLGALSRHRGEMARHPYHLRQPARMMDNVRRGGEMLAGLGHRPPDFPFGEIYRLSMLDGDRFIPLSRPKVVLPGETVGLADLAVLFENGT